MQPRYWRNDRKNMQCFPFCPEFGTLFNAHSADVKHRKKGTCMLPVKLSVRLPSALLHSSGGWGKLCVIVRFVPLDERVVDGALVGASSASMMPQQMSPGELTAMLNDNTGATTLAPAEEPPRKRRR